MADRRYAAETRLPVRHKRVKFGSKILSRWGKYCQKTLGGGKILHSCCRLYEIWTNIDRVTVTVT